MSTPMRRMWSPCCATRRKRPRRRRAAEQRDELRAAASIPPHNSLALCDWAARVKQRASEIRLMSALGQKRTYAVQNSMSALPPKAEMCSALGDVR